MTSRRGRRPRRGRSRRAKGRRASRTTRRPTAFSPGATRRPSSSTRLPGKVVASIANGTRVDALGWDPSRKLIYIPNGGRGQRHGRPPGFARTSTPSWPPSPRSPARRRSPLTQDSQRVSLPARARAGSAAAGGCAAAGAGARTRPRSARPDPRRVVYRYQVVTGCEVAAATGRFTCESCSSWPCCRSSSGRLRPAITSSARSRSAAKAAGTTSTVDSAARRLYVSHATHVVVVDLDANKVVGDIPDTPGRARHRDRAGAEPRLHQQRPRQQRDDLRPQDAEGDRQVADRRESRLDPLRRRFGAGLRLQRPIEDATAIDAKTGTVAATIPLPGKPGVLRGGWQGQDLRQHRGHERDRRNRRRQGCTEPRVRRRGSHGRPHRLAADQPQWLGLGPAYVVCILFGGVPHGAIRRPLRAAAGGPRPAGESHRHARLGADPAWRDGLDLERQGPVDGPAHVELTASRSATCWSTAPR